jgi:hypothetical protein
MRDFYDGFRDFLQDEPRGTMVKSGMIDSLTWLGEEI